MRIDRRTALQALPFAAATLAIPRYANATVPEAATPERIVANLPLYITQGMNGVLRRFVIKQQTNKLQADDVLSLLIVYSMYAGALKQAGYNDAVLRTLTLNRTDLLTNDLDPAKGRLITGYFREIGITKSDAEIQQLLQFTYAQRESAIALISKQGVDGLNNGVLAALQQLSETLPNQNGIEGTGYNSASAHVRKIYANTAYCNTMAALLFVAVLTGNAPAAAIAGLDLYIEC